jgi:polyphosphate kinase 2 (PPK2 family)
MLADNGVVQLKFMLHISRDEQKARFEERIEDETKNWKFRVGDLDDRKRWDDYTQAYRSILEKTSTEWAPWYLVPADDKDVRNYLVARCIADTLESLDLRYPPADPALAQLEIQ